MVRRIILITSSVLMVLVFGMFGFGVSGCLRSGPEHSVDLTKTAVCEVGATSYNFKIDAELIESITGYFGGSTNPFPDGIDLCFTSTSVGNGVFSLGVWERLLSSTYSAGLMNLKVIPQEVSEDVDLNTLEYDLELSWSETFVTDLWDQIGEDVVRLSDAPFSADNKDILMILAAAQDAFETYFAGWTCTAKATCADLQNTESSIKFNCSTKKIGVDDIMDSFGDEAFTALNLLIHSGDDEEDSCEGDDCDDGEGEDDGPSIEDLLAITIPALEFEWNLTPCEDDCTVFGMAENNGMDLFDFMMHDYEIDGVVVGSEKETVSTREPLYLTNTRLQSGSPDELCWYDGAGDDDPSREAIGIMVDSLDMYDDNYSNCIAISKNDVLTYISNTTTSGRGLEGGEYFYTSANSFIGALAQAGVVSGETIHLCQVEDGECASDLYDIKVYYDAGFCSR